MRCRHFIFAMIAFPVVSIAQDCSWEKQDVSGPGERFVCSMAYDSGREVAVFFGGFGGVKVWNDTWEWDGHAWTHRADSGPPARGSASIAYDSARAVTVLFRGQ